MNTDELIEENREFFTTFFEARRRYDLVKKVAGEYFDFLFKLSKVKLDSTNKKRFEDSKEAFIDIVVKHFQTHEMISITVPNSNGNVLGQRVTINRKRLTEMTTEEINGIITSYGVSVVFFLSLLKPYNQKLIQEAERAKKFVGGHLTEEKIILYKNIFKVSDNKKFEGENPKWTDVFNWVSKRKDENGDSLISDDVDRRIQRKTFCNFRSRHKLNSLKEFNKYLQDNNYPQE